MSKHLQVGEFRYDTRDLQRSDECVVRIQVSDNLETTAKGDDLTFDVLLQNPTP